MATTRVCVNPDCNTEFKARRRTALTCGKACKSKLERERRKLRDEGRYPYITASRGGSGSLESFDAPPRPGESLLYAEAVREGTVGNLVDQPKKRFFRRDDDRASKTFYSLLAQEEALHRPRTAAEHDLAIRQRNNPGVALPEYTNAHVAAEMARRVREANEARQARHGPQDRIHNPDSSAVARAGRAQREQNRHRQPSARPVQRSTEVPRASQSTADDPQCTDFMASRNTPRWQIDPGNR